MCSVVFGAIYALLQSSRADKLRAKLSACFKAPRHTRGSYSGVEMDDELNPITESFVNCVTEEEDEDEENKTNNKMEGFDEAVL
eukprot:gene31050-38377_t